MPVIAGMTFSYSVFFFKNLFLFKGRVPFVSISPASCFCYPLSSFFWIFAKKPQMVIHPDQQYLEGLLHNDTQIVEDIYRRFAPVTKHHVLHNSGSEEDAADIFQESLIDIYNQAKYKDLKLTCPFE